LSLVSFRWTSFPVHLGLERPPVGDLPGGCRIEGPANNRHKVLDGAVKATYSQGHILFMRDRTLMAQPFDKSSFETRGDAAPVAEQVDSLDSFVGLYGVSQNGVLAYSSGAAGKAVESAANVPFTVVMNWAVGLKK
jgi:hypothetical protein